MESINLTEEEILGIKSFVEEATSIPLVECIYLLPFLDREQLSASVEVITVCNGSLYYNGRLIGKEEMRPETLKEWDLVGELGRKFNEQYGSTRLSFQIEDSWNYSLSLMHRREWVCERQIVSGTIIFDRFGEKANNKEAAQGYFKPYLNVLPIDNIDEVLGESPKK